LIPPSLKIQVHVQNHGVRAQIFTAT